MEAIGQLTEGIDVAQVVLYTFWVFFAGLVFYLRREDRREGFPLVNDVTGKVEDPGVVWLAEPKAFKMVDGSVHYAPDPSRADTRAIAAEPIGPYPGAPLTPTGDPMKDGVGPAAWAERADKPDLTYDGRPKIVPMREDNEFSIADGDPDPRGFDVVGADGLIAGVVSDVWVDRSEFMIRYLEVEFLAPESTPDQPVTRRVLFPMNFATVDGKRQQVTTFALLSTDFKNIPVTKDGTTVTLLEEDKVMAYFSGGTLYAIPSRTEPLL